MQPLRSSSARGARSLVGGALGAIVLHVAALSACGAPPPGGPDEEAPFVRPASLDVELVSRFGDATSDGVGANCMECHQANGDGPGRFSVAGTLLDAATGGPAKSARVQLWTGAFGTGELVVELEADARGNFYTTQAIGIEERLLFPFVVGATTTRGMPFQTSSAACNKCHVGRLRLRAQ